MFKLFGVPSAHASTSRARNASDRITRVRLVNEFNAALIVRPTSV